MPYSLDQLELIFDRTDGRCHLCHSDLYFEDYGAPAYKDGWEVEHSRPRARGGTDHPNNLYAACVSCNRRKGTRSSAEFRRDLGLSGPPRRRAGIEWGEVIAVAGLFAGGVVVFGALASAAQRTNPPAPDPRLAPDPYWSSSAVHPPIWS